MYFIILDFECFNRDDFKSSNKCVVKLLTTNFKTKCLLCLSKSILNLFFSTIILGYREILGI